MAAQSEKILACDGKMDSGDADSSRRGLVYTNLFRESMHLCN